MLEGVGRKISEYSSYAYEEEVLVPFGTPLSVSNVAKGLPKKMSIVNLCKHRFDVCSGCSKEEKDIYSCTICNKKYCSSCVDIAQFDGNDERWKCFKCDSYQASLNIKISIPI